MARVATALRPTASGGFIARKRIPEDVQDEYEKLYGVRWEERWNSNGAVPVGLANAKAREWLSEIEARISNIRAGRRGDGRTLTPKQARGLAGDWYRWFTTRHLAKPRPAADWEDHYSALYDEVQGEIWTHGGEPFDPERDPFEVWEISPKARERVRPMVADWGEVSQFLHAKTLTLDPASREMLLDFVSHDIFAALRLLIRRARGDYGEDQHANQFPSFERTGDPGLTPWALFEQWVTEAKPKNSTVNRWRAVFLKLNEGFPVAATITPEEAQVWARQLVSPARGARTVRDVWVVAARTVFAWAVSQRLLAHNPFSEVQIAVPRAATTRETKAFTPEETRTILSAALAVNPKSKTQAAKRWAPWLCAYTGARVGEVTQLRGADVIMQGIPSIKITPEAGTVKTRKPRTVPLHEHLIEQGFLEFAKASGKGPLFYSERKTPQATVDVTNPPRPPYVIARVRLAEWVRKLGITDKELQPNHAWRHTFKQIADRADIREKISDAITGHAQQTVGRGYGEPMLADKAEALKKFPRYVIGDGPDGRP
jgi:integrase